MYVKYHRVIYYRLLYRATNRLFRKIVFFEWYVVSLFSNRNVSYYLFIISAFRPFAAVHTIPDRYLWNNNYYNSHRKKIFYSSLTRPLFNARSYTLKLMVKVFSPATSRKRIWTLKITAFYIRRERFLQFSLSVLFLCFPVENYNFMNTMKCNQTVRKQSKSANIVH